MRTDKTPLSKTYNFCPTHFDDLQYYEPGTLRGKLMRRILHILFIILAGCASNDDINFPDETITTINIDSLSIDNADAGITKIEYIPLETNSDCILGEVSKILFKDSLFFVFDLIKAKSLFIFNRDGSFYNKFDNKGRGPEECLMPMDFCLDDSANVYIFDIGSSKIVKYSIDGKFIAEYKVNIRFDEFYMVNPDEFYFKNGYEEGINKICLGSYDIRTNKVTTIIPVRSIFDDMSIIRFSTHYFFESGGGIKFCPRFSNEIFEISKNGFSRVCCLV